MKKWIQNEITKLEAYAADLRDELAACTVWNSAARDFTNDLMLTNRRIRELYAR